MRRTWVARCQVDADLLSFQPLEVLIQCAPVRSDAEVVVVHTIRSENGVVHRRHRSSFSRDLRRDALEDLGRQVRVDENREIGLAQHVDESRCDNHSPCIDPRGCGCFGESADRSNPTVSNAYVPGVPR